MDGVDIIKKERERQIHEEGWEFFKLTGWDADWFRCNYANTDSVIRNLAKAGALIAAEIDRLNRKKIKDEDS